MRQQPSGSAYWGVTVRLTTLIEMWIDYKMENEVLGLRLRPHPHEVFLYYDC